MTALAASAARQRRNLKNIKSAKYAVGTGAVIYQGSLVAWNTSTKRAVAATKTTARKFLGIAAADATGNTAGTVFVKVEYGHEELIDAAAAATGGYVGATVAVNDDNQVTTASGAGTAGVQVLVGEFIELESGDAWVAIRQYSRANV